MNFELNHTVTITVSQQSAEVIGRAEYVTGEPQYLLRYVTAQGDATEQWWSQSALS